MEIREDEKLRVEWLEDRYQKAPITKADDRSSEDSIN